MAIKGPIQRPPHQGTVTQQDTTAKQGKGEYVRKDTQTSAGDFLQSAFGDAKQKFSDIGHDLAHAGKNFSRAARAFTTTIGQTESLADLPQTVAAALEASAQIINRPNYEKLTQDFEQILDLVRNAHLKDKASLKRLTEMEAQYDGLLGAGLASALFDYSMFPAEAERQESRVQVQSFADRLYFHTPTEDRLRYLLATYAVVGRDVVQMRRQVAQNRDMIAGHIPAAAEPLLQAADPFRAPLHTTQRTDASAIFQQDPQKRSAMDATQARIGNAYWEPLVPQTEQRVLDIIASAHVAAPHERLAQQGSALHWLGASDKAQPLLFQARNLFKKDKVKISHDSLTTQVRVLQRIAELNSDDIALGQEVLGEASGVIDWIRTDFNADHGQLLTVQNMALELPFKLRALDEKNAKAEKVDLEAYHKSVIADYQRVIRYARTIRSKDPAVIAAAHDHVLNLAAQKIEKELDRALLLYRMGDTDDAHEIAQSADNHFTELQRHYEPTASKQGVSEAQARKFSAEATYQFDVGHPDEAIRLLHVIKDQHADSTAAQILAQPDPRSWVREFNILDERGRFNPKLNTPDGMAQLKTAAGRVFEHKAELVRAAILGGVTTAVVANVAAADAVAGSHVGGGLAMGGIFLGGALLGASAEGTHQLYKHRDEISASYRTGVSNVRTEELIHNAKEFGIEIACLTVGGFYGRLAKNAFMVNQVKYSNRVIQWLEGRGMIRPGALLAEDHFLVRETGILAESLVFHPVSGAAHTVFDSQYKTTHTFTDYFMSYLTLRALAGANEINVGALLTPGTSAADGVARQAVNMLLAQVPIQTAHSTIAGDFSHFGDEYWRGLTDLYAISFGQHLAGHLPQAQAHVTRLSNMLDARKAQRLARSESKILQQIANLKSDIEYAETPQQRLALTQDLLAALTQRADILDQSAQLGLTSKDVAGHYRAAVIKFREELLPSAAPKPPAPTLLERAQGAARRVLTQRQQMAKVNTNQERIARLDQQISGILPQHHNAAARVAKLREKQYQLAQANAERLDAVDGLEGAAKQWHLIANDHYLQHRQAQQLSDLEAQGQQLQTLQKLQRITPPLKQKGELLQQVEGVLAARLKLAQDMFADGRLSAEALSKIETQGKILRIERQLYTNSVQLDSLPDVIAASSENATLLTLHHARYLLMKEANNLEVGRFPPEVLRKTDATIHFLERNLEDPHGLPERTQLYQNNMAALSAQITIATVVTHALDAEVTLLKQITKFPKKAEPLFAKVAALMQERQRHLLNHVKQHGGDNTGILQALRQRFTMENRLLQAASRDPKLIPVVLQTTHNSQARFKLLREFLATPDAHMRKRMDARMRAIDAHDREQLGKLDISALPGLPKPLPTAKTAVKYSGAHITYAEVKAIATTLLAHATRLKNALLRTRARSLQLQIEALERSSTHPVSIPAVQSARARRLSELHVQAQALASEIHNAEATAQAHQQPADSRLGLSVEVARIVKSYTRNWDPESSTHPETHAALESALAYTVGKVDFPALMNNPQHGHKWAHLNDEFAHFPQILGSVLDDMDGLAPELHHPGSPYDVSSAAERASDSGSASYVRQVAKDPYRRRQLQIALRLLDDYNAMQHKPSTYQQRYVDIIRDAVTDVPIEKTQHQHQLHDRKQSMRSWIDANIAGKNEDTQAQAAVVLIQHTLKELSRFENQIGIILNAAEHGQLTPQLHDHFKNLSTELAVSLAAREYTITELARAMGTPNAQKWVYDLIASSTARFSIVRTTFDLLADHLTSPEMAKEVHEFFESARAPTDGIPIEHIQFRNHFHAYLRGSERPQRGPFANFTWPADPHHPLILAGYRYLGETPPKTIEPAHGATPPNFKATQAAKPGARAAAPVQLSATDRTAPFQFVPAPRTVLPYETSGFTISGALAKGQLGAPHAIYTELSLQINTLINLKDGGKNAHEIQEQADKLYRLLATIHDRAQHIPHPNNGNPVKSPLEGYLRVYYDKDTEKQKLKDTFKLIDQKEGSNYVGLFEKFRQEDVSRDFDPGLISLVRSQQPRLYRVYDNAAIAADIKNGKIQIARILRGIILYNLMNVHSTPQFLEPTAIARNLHHIFDVMNRNAKTIPPPEGRPASDTTVAAYISDIYLDPSTNKVMMDRALKTLDSVRSPRTGEATNYRSATIPHRISNNAIDVFDGTNPLQQLHKSGRAEVERVPEFDASKTAPSAAPIMPERPIELAPPKNIQLATDINRDILSAKQSIPHYSMRAMQPMMSTMGSPDAPDPGYGHIPAFIDARSGQIVAIMLSLPLEIAKSGIPTLDIRLNTFDPSMDPTLRPFHIKLIAGDMAMMQALPAELLHTIRATPEGSMLRWALHHARRDAQGGPVTLQHLFTRRVCDVSSGGAAEEITTALRELIGTAIVVQKVRPNGTPGTNDHGPGSLPPARDTTMPAGRSHSKSTDTAADPRLPVISNEPIKVAPTPERSIPHQYTDAVTTAEFMGIIAQRFHKGQTLPADLQKVQDDVVEHLITIEAEIDKKFASLVTDQFMARNRARTDAYLRMLDLRAQSELRARFGNAATVTELDVEAVLTPIVTEILNEAFAGPTIPGLKGRIDITDRDGILVLRPENLDDFAAIRALTANKLEDRHNLPFGFFNPISALGIPVIVISPECSEEAWGILRHELEHYKKFASNRLERGAVPPLAKNFVTDGTVNPAAQTRYMNGMRDYLFRLAKDETLAHLTNTRPPQGVVTDLTQTDGLYDFIETVKPEIAQRITDDIGTATVTGKHHGPMTAQDYAVSRVETLRDRHNQGITKNVWLLYDAVETLVDNGYHPEMARQALIHALTPVPYTNWSTQLPKIITQLAAQPAPKVLPESLDPQDHRFRLRRWLDKENPTVNDVQQLVDQHMAALKTVQHELTQPLSVKRLQQLRQEWRHQVSEPQQLLEVLHLMLGEMESRKEVMRRRGNNVPEEVRVTAKIDHIKKLIDTVKRFGQDPTLNITAVQARIDRRLLVHTAHLQDAALHSAREVVDGKVAAQGPERNAAYMVGGAAMMADVSAGLHHVWSTVSDTVAAHPLTTVAAVAAAASVALFYNRFTETGRLNTVIKTLGIQTLIDAHSPNPKDPILSLNFFLRGEMGREPTHAEVKKFEKLTWEYRERAAIYGRLRDNRVPHTHQIYQIYNAEFVDALAARISAEAQAFRQIHGREPIIVEIAAGDGRLARALQRRGLAITATDSDEWQLGQAGAVDGESLENAIQRADIILGSWLPPSGPVGHADSDFQIAHHLVAHPEKTYIQIEAATTNTGPFKELVRAGQKNGTLLIEEPPEFSGLLTSRLEGNTPRYEDDEFAARAPHTDTRSHLRIYRGTGKAAPQLPHLPPPLKSASHAAPEPAPTKKTNAPWANGPLRHNLNAIAGSQNAILFDTLPIAATADFDTREAARNARLPILAPWVRKHLFEYKGTLQILRTMKQFAQGYRKQLESITTAQERAALHAQWKCESALFNEIAELMLQQARTPDERDAATEVHDRLLNGETGDLGAVATLFENAVIPPDLWQFEKHPNFHNIISIYNDLSEMAAVFEVAATPKDLATLTRVMWDTDISDYLLSTTTYTLNAITSKMAFEAMIHQSKLLSQIAPILKFVPDAGKVMSRVTIPNSPYSLALRLGKYQTICGMELVLIETQDKVSSELGNIGFQHSSHGTEITQYQGGTIGKEQLNEKLLKFKKFSGGVPPMEWLAMIAGPILLQKAQAAGGQLRWIAGERILFAYPHAKDTLPPHIKSVADTRGPWKNKILDAEVARYDRLIEQLKTADSSQHKRIAKEIAELQPLVSTYNNGPRTAKMYDDAAALFGFAHTDPNTPFHTYSKGSLAYGQTLRERSNKGVLDRSLEAATQTMRADKIFGLWLDDGKVTKHSGPDFRGMTVAAKHAAESLLAGVHKIWTLLPEIEDAPRSQRPAASPVGSDPVEDIVDNTTLSDAQKILKLRRTFYTIAHRSGDITSTSAVLAFFEYVRLGKLSDAEIRAGANDIAKALMARPEHEQRPFAPYTFGGYMKNFLGVTSRDFSHSQSKQLQIWTQEAYNGFIRRANTDAIQNGQLPSLPPPLAAAPAPLKVHYSSAASLAARAKPPPQAARPPLGIVGGAGEYPDFKYPLTEGRAVDRVSPTDIKKFFSRFFNSKDMPGAVATALRHSHTPAEAFIKLLNLRVKTQLQKKFGARATLTDMDLEAERNRVMAEVLGATLGGANIPVAKGRMTITSENNVLIVRPSTENDYAHFDNTIADSGIHSEPLTGGFFCNSNALGIPIIFINPSVGSKAWGVYRHEKQHSKQSPLNRSDPAHTLIGVSMVDKNGAIDSYATTVFIQHAADHYLIGARDETLAFFTQGSMAIETISRLQHSQLYDYIGNHHDELITAFRNGIGDQMDTLFGSEEKFAEWANQEIVKLRQHYNRTVEESVNLLHSARMDLVERGYHPETAKALLIQNLSRVSYVDWKTAIPRLLTNLQGKPPQRTIPKGSGLEGEGLKLRRRIEKEFLAFDDAKDKISAVIATETAKIRDTSLQVSATNDVAILQNLRRQWSMGNTLLEQMTEVLHYMTDEYFALDKNTSQLFAMRRMIQHALDKSGLDTLRAVIDRKLLLRAAHTQHDMQANARKSANATPHNTEPLPRLRPTDVAAMNPKNRISQVIRLRTTIAAASDSSTLKRAVNLYATLIRHGEMGDYRLQREFDSLTEIVLQHPDRMPTLKLAFAAVRGATEDALWNRFLEQTIPKFFEIAERDPQFPGMFKSSNLVPGTSAK